MAKTVSGVEHPVDVHVGGRIRALRRSMKLSQERLAEALGLTFQQVQKYERGANRVSASKLFEIARFLNTPITYFFDGYDGGQAATGVAESEQAPFIHDMMKTNEGVDLARYFNQITDPKVRRKVVELARILAESGGGEG